MNLKIKAPRVCAKQHVKTKKQDLRAVKRCKLDLVQMAQIRLNSAMLFKV